MVRHELGLMWREFKFSLKRSLTVIMIILVIIMIIAVNVVSAIISNSISTNPAIFNKIAKVLSSVGLTASGVSDIVYWVLLLFLFASIIRGVLSSNFGLLFTRADENLISPSPLASHALFVGKRMKTFVLHAIGVAVILITGVSIVSMIGFNGIEFGLLFISLLATVEFYGLTENAFHCLSRALTMRQRHLKLLGLAGLIGLLSYTVAIPLLIILGLNLGAFNALLNYFPPYLLSRILTLDSSLDISNGAISAAIATIVVFAIAASSAGIGLKRWSSSPSLANTGGRFLRLRKNKLKWKSGGKNEVSLILRKEFWVSIRNPSRFLIPVVIDVALVVFSLQIQLFFPFIELQLSNVTFAEPVFLLSSYFLAAFALPPAWDSFAAERHTAYLLKTSPINPRSVIVGKYLFALIKSILYVAPIVVALSLILPHTISTSIVLLETVLILMVSNGIGILASASYPPAYRNVGPPPFLIVIGLPLAVAVVTAVIPILFITYYGDLILLAFISIIMLFYSIFVALICIAGATNSFIQLLEV
jgi:hypothetical protein